MGRLWFTFVALAVSASIGTGVAVASPQEEPGVRGTRESIRSLARRAPVAGDVEDAVDDASSAERTEPARARGNSRKKDVSSSRVPIRVDRSKALDESDAVREQARVQREADRERERRVDRPPVADQFHHGYQPRYRSYGRSGYGYGSPRYSGGYGAPYYYGGYGAPYYYGGYPYVYPYGYGFGPVAFGISGPQTTRYADPVGRQHRMVDEAIRNFAENPGGIRP